MRVTYDYGICTMFSCHFLHQIHYRDSAINVLLYNHHLVFFFFLDVLLSFPDPSVRMHRKPVHPLFCCYLLWPYLTWPGLTWHDLIQFWPFFGRSWFFPCKGVWDFEPIQNTVPTKTPFLDISLPSRPVWHVLLQGGRKFCTLVTTCCLSFFRHLFRLLSSVSLF